MRIKKLKCRDKGIDVEPRFKIVSYGNYNRYGSVEKCTGKHLGLMVIDELGVDLNWKHQEILDLLTMYHQADVKSMADIKSGNAGECKNCETSFIVKVRMHLTKLELGQMNPADAPDKQISLFEVNKDGH